MRVTKYFVIQYVAKKIFTVLVSSNSVIRIYIIRSAVSFRNTYTCLHSRISSMILRAWYRAHDKWIACRSHK